MEIFVFEFFTGGGLWLWRDPAQGRQVVSLPYDSFLREGAAMRQALLDDFGRLPGARVTTLHDARLAHPPPPALSTTITDEPSFGTKFERACRRADFVLLIAPECGGWLWRLVRAAEQMGSKLLSPGSAFVQWATDKHATANLLKGKNARATDGMRCREFLACGEVPPVEYPLVAKPMDGAGSSGICVIHHRAELQTLLDSGQLRDYDRCERLQRGRAASITCLCGPRAAHSLQPCWQHLSDDGAYQYVGGAIMLEEQMIGRARRLMAPLQPLLRTTVGLVGIDFVLDDDPRGQQDVIIEVNPRVTTSYVGLRRYHGCNLAQAMIDIAEGRAIDIERQVNSPCSGWHWTSAEPTSKSPTEKTLP